MWECLKLKGKLKIRNIIEKAVWICKLRIIIKVFFFRTLERMTIINYKVFLEKWLLFLNR